MSTSAPSALPGPLGAAAEYSRPVLDPVRRAWDHPRFGPAFKVVVLYLVLVEGVVQFVFGRIDIPGVELGFLEHGVKDRPLPRGLFIQGAVIGSLYALVALGLILVYRANRIINFAQAQLGAVPAVLALLLIARQDWPYLAVIPILLVGSALLGGVVEVTLVRRFSNSPRLILTVVTIGIGYLLLVLEFFTKEWVAGDLVDTLALQFPTPFADYELALGPVTLKGDHFFAVAVVGVLVIALGAFFRYTDMGIAVRASAENGERASLLGIPVRRVSTVVWMLAAVLSGIGVFLRAPLVGLPLTGFVGPSVLLFGLATAVMARMERLPMAFAAGMLIGIVDRAALFSTRRASLANAVMVVVVVLALLIQRKGLSRAYELGASTWQAVREVRPVPAELRHLREVVWARIGLGLVVLALVVAAPWLVGDQTELAATLAIYAMVGVSLVILTGWAGQISLGQFAIAGIGAATAGGLAANHGWDFFASLFVGGLAGALAAVLIGLPALRIQGLFLAVTTLAFAFAVQNFVLTKEYFDWLLPEGGFEHFVARPVLYDRFDLASDSEILGITLGADAKFYYLCLAFLLLTLAGARAMRRTRSGRVLIGVRDNGRAMEALGVNLARTRLVAFAISGFIAAVAGGLFAYQLGDVPPAAFPPETSILVFIMTVIGGIASLSGAMLGAVYVLGVPLLPGLRDVELIELLTSGIGLIVLLLFLPGGLSEGFYRLRDGYLRRVADRRGIHVPSLVADSLVDHDEQVEEDRSLDVAAARLAGTPSTVPEEDGEAPGDGNVIGCPVCGARLPVDEAQHHEHLQADRSVGARQ